MTSFGEEARKRIEAWERESGRKANTLSRDEWLDVMESVLACPRFELEEWLDNRLAARYN